MIISLSLFLMATAVYIYINRNSEKIIYLVENRINHSDKGVWCVDSIGVNILKNYPKIELSAYSTALYADSIEFKRGNPIAHISKISFTASSVELLQKNATINSLQLTDIELNIQKKGKNQYNITPLLISNSEIKSTTPINSDSSSISRIKSHAIEVTGRLREELESKFVKTLKGLKLDVKELSFDNIAVNYSDEKFRETIEIDKIITNFFASDSLITLRNGKSNFYGIPINFVAQYQRASKEFTVDFTSESSSEKSDGKIIFDGVSKIGLTAEIDSHIDALKLSKGDVNGEIWVKGYVVAQYDLESRKFDNRGTNLDFNIINLELEKAKKSTIKRDKNSKIVTPLPKILKGDIVIYNEEIEGKNLDIEMGINRLKANFSISNILDFANSPENFDLPLKVDAKADSFNSYMVRERLGLEIDTLNSRSDIRNLDLKLSTTLTPSIIALLKSFKDGEIATDRVKQTILIEDYSLQFADGRRLSNLSGKTEINGLSVKLVDIKAQFDGNPIEFDGQLRLVENRGDKLFDKIEINADIQSDKMLLKDLIFNEFAYPKTDGDVLSSEDNIEFNKITANIDFELYPPLNIPSKSFDNYNFKVSNALMMLSGEQVEGDLDIRRYGDKITIKNSKAKYLGATTEIEGSVWAKNREKSDTIAIFIKNLDFDKLRKGRDEKIKFLKFHKKVLANVDIEKLTVSNNIFNDFSTQMSLGNPDTIIVKSLISNFADGKIDFSAIITKNIKNNIIVDFDGKFDQLSIEKIDLELIERLKVQENSIEGVLTGGGNGKILVKNFEEIDLNSTFAKLDFTLSSIRLVDFKFPSSVKRYLRRLDVADILIDTLQNSVTVESGKISLPRMNIASSIGNYFVESQIYTQSDSVDLILEIPYNIASRAALGVVFGGNSDDNRTQEQKIYDEVRKRYIKLYITANSDDVKVSIRDRENRKEERINAKEQRKEYERIKKESRKQ